MGADGGSIPDRRDLVKTKGKAEQTDKALQRELFILCALSKKPLTRPVVLDPIGKLYNKDAVLEYFLDKTSYGDGEQICGHLKSMKELLTLNVTSNPDYVPPTSLTVTSGPSRTPFVCPLSLREMSGSVPFIALRNCGCVFSEAAIRAVVPSLTKGVVNSTAKKDDSPESDGAKKSGSPPSAGEEEGGGGKKDVACPNCGKSFDPTAINAVLSINPPKDVQDALLEHLLLTRATAKSSKKRKAITTTTVNVDGITTEPPSKSARTLPPPSSRSGTNTSAPSINAPRSVHDKLAEQEKKRLKAQEGMSEAVKAMFKPKDNGGVKKSGADDFFGRTFTRYA
ncbi:hypothetical protein IAR55_001836 [Kwoniella newhampshirensis]|uniref:Replication termination factor 2 n=1 Tax=Kwoniella newhampshirensis TaxID=1651941 RepID=A0AAW0Z3B6_9TREE